MKMWDRERDLEGEKSGEKQPKGFFTKVKSLYGSYQKAKDEEVEKLHLYESISLAARLDKEFGIANLIEFDYVSRNKLMG